MKRRISFILILLLSCAAGFSQSYGFVSIQPGFFKWCAAVLMAIVLVILPPAVWGSTVDNSLYIPDKLWAIGLTIMPFPVIGFWIFPTTFCSLFGAVISIFVFNMFYKNKWHMKTNLLVFVNLFFTLITVCVSTPQQWWLWKYYLLAYIFYWLGIFLGKIERISKAKCVLLGIVFTVSNLSLTIFAASIKNEIMTLVMAIVFLSSIVLIVIAGISSYRKVSIQRDEKYKKLFSKTYKEVNELFKQIKKLAKIYSEGYGAEHLQSSLRLALENYDYGEKHEAAKYLEKFFDTEEDEDYDLGNYKFKDERQTYSSFCTIAEKLAKAVGYKHKKEIVTINTDDDDFDELYDSKPKKKLKKGNKMDLNDKSIDSLMKELNSMIGLKKVKEEVASQIGLLKLNQQREKMGLPSTNVSRHLIFTGNPGTGKTTVARVVAKIYKELGILDEGQCIETDYAGLVSEYISDTPQKTRAVVKKALGGVLFIDEAYTLAPPDKPKDHGQEAIDTLLKYMEDKRDDFVVIAAGYSNEMKNFIESNPGLESRFTTYIHFEDYDGDELYEIFMQMCNAENKQLVVPEELKPRLKIHFKNIYENRPSNFANGREVRNYLEACEKRMAFRLSNSAVDKLTKEQLTTFCEEDLGLGSEE